MGESESKDIFKILFTPISIGPVWIKNRIAMAPMGLVGMVESDGSINRRIIEYYVERVRGGVGLIITGLTRVENEIEKLTLGWKACSTYTKLCQIYSVSFPVN